MLPKIIHTGIHRYEGTGVRKTEMATQYRNCLLYTSTMNAAVHTAATQQRLVGSIDDGVHLHFCDVISDDLKRHDQALSLIHI